jgi:hypothetical protein
MTTQAEIMGRVPACNQYTVSIGENNGRHLFAQYSVVAADVQAAAACALELLAREGLDADVTEEYEITSILHVGAIDAVQQFTDFENFDALDTVAEKEPEPYFDPSWPRITAENESVEVRTFGRLLGVLEEFDPDGDRPTTTYFFEYDGVVYVEDEGPLPPPIYGAQA